MKIVLSDGKQYMVSLVTMVTENRLCVGFIGVQSYDELRAALTPEALSVIKYYSDENTESFDTYEDYTKFIKTSTTEAEDGTLDVAVYLEKPDEITILKNTVSQMDSTVAALGSQVNPTINTDTCTLEESKAWQINLSKVNLETYLAANPITSTCHGETEKQYSVTKDKRDFLTQEIAISQMAVQSGIDYQPSWNATGENCTYDWTLQELQQLTFEIAIVVKPLVSKQQSMETDLNAAETKEALLAVDIIF